MTADAHKDNPLSNPEDRAHYMRRIKQEAARARDTANNAFQATLPAVPQLPKQQALPSVRFQVERGTLRSWMKQFAVWLISLERVPSPEQQVAKASKLAKGKVSYALIKLLRRRADFVEYVDKLQADAVETARAQYEAMFPMMTQIMHAKLEKAAANPDKLDRGTEKIIEQGVERFAPKKSDPDEAPRTIHIHLNARTQKLAEAEIEPMQDVEVLKAGEAE